MYLHPLSSEVGCAHADGCVNANFDCPSSPCECIDDLHRVWCDSGNGSSLIGSCHASLQECENKCPGSCLSSNANGDKACLGPSVCDAPDVAEWCPVTGRGFGKLDVHKINSSTEAPLSVCSFECAILGDAVKCREKGNKRGYSCPEKKPCTACLTNDYESRYKCSNPNKGVSGCGWSITTGHCYSKEACNTIFGNASCLTAFSKCDSAYVVPPLSSYDRCSDKCYYGFCPGTFPMKDKFLYVRGDCMSERLCKEELACNGHAEGCSIAANGFCPVKKVKRDCLGGGGVFWDRTVTGYENTYCFHTIGACKAAVSYSAHKLGGYGGTCIASLLENTSAFDALEEASHNEEA